MRKFLLTIASLLLFAGCAGTARGCAVTNAQAFGADWVVVQMDAYGTPFRCWTLTDTSIANEDHSDGIYWQSPSGHLVHISGHYNRVQVQDGQWDSALHEVGLTQETCREIQEAQLPSRIRHQEL